jgi:hypothetical protein
MRTILTAALLLGGVAQALAAPPQGPLATPPMPPPPAFAFALNARYACVTPQVSGHARADGGFIDVQMPTPNALAIRMTGTAAANSHLACTGTASETFHLVQEFEITSSDPAITSVVLTLDSALVGYVRSKHKAGACARLANVSVTPAGWDNTPLMLAHPPLCVEGTSARLCNQHLPPLQGPPMSVGRYCLTADFVIDATAGGICDGHAVADFSPDTALPADWVRMRDPFQGVAKSAFGYSITLTAAPAGPVPLTAGVRVKPLTRRVSLQRGPVPNYQPFGREAQLRDGLVLPAAARTRGS